MRRSMGKIWKSSLEQLRELAAFDLVIVDLSSGFGAMERAAPQRQTGSWSQLFRYGTVKSWSVF